MTGSAIANAENSTRSETFLDSRKALACIHCGLCLSSCPTYLETGDENNSPRGRIHLMKALQDGRMALEEAPVRHLDLCLGCRACEAACPSGVEYGALLEATREFVERQHQRSFWQRFLRRVVIEKVFPFPERMQLALLPARWLKRAGLAGWLPKMLRDTVDLVPEHITEGVLPTLSPATGGRARGRVGFIGGCVMNVMFGRTNEASIRLLNRAGYDVVVPVAQGCCGALYAHGGNLEMARSSARRNIAVFEEHALDAIIINAAGCGSTLKEYGHLLEHDSAWHDRAVRFSARVKDLTEWLAQNGLRPSGSPPGPTTEPTVKVTFHDACHLAHAQRITRAPRQLVQAVAGRGFIELVESDVCCGSAGSYNLTEPEMAERLQRRKINNVLASGASIVISTNPGCLMQIRAGLDRAGARHIQTLHIADYLEQFGPG